MPGGCLARWVHRRLEVKVEESELFESTSLVTLTRLLLAAASSRMSEGVTCYTADVHGPFLNVPQTNECWERHWRRTSENVGAQICGGGNKSNQVSW